MNFYIHWIMAFAHVDFEEAYWEQCKIHDLFFYFLDKVSKRD